MALCVAHIDITHKNLFWKISEDLLWMSIVLNWCNWYFLPLPTHINTTLTETFLHFYIFMRASFMFNNQWPSGFTILVGTTFFLHVFMTHFNFALIKTKMNE